MPLQRLNENIHGSQGEKVASSRLKSDGLDPRIIKAQSPFEEGVHWSERSFDQKRKKRIMIWSFVAGILVLSIAGTIGYKIWLKDAFHEDRVVVSFEGPLSVDSAQQTKYAVKISNDNWLALRDAEILFSYPENFQPTDNVNLKYLSPSSSLMYVGDVPSRGSVTLEIGGMFYAPEDYPVYVRGALRYGVGVRSEKVVREGQVSVMVTSAPVVLELAAPQDVADGDNVEYVVDYKNYDARAFKDVQVRFEYADGFSFVGADPAPSQQDNTWILGTLEPGETGKIRIRGKISGSEGQSKAVRATLGYVNGEGLLVAFNTREKVSRVVRPVLAITQTVEGIKDAVVGAGEVLKFRIAYKNTGNMGMRDAIVTTEIKGKAVDFAKIEAGKGALDVSRGIITWKASDIPGLGKIEPQGGGEISFSVPVLANLPMNGPQDKNQVISVFSKIDSPDIPTNVGSNKVIGSNTLEMKIATKALFEMKALYGEGAFPKTGAMPMKVGQPTYFGLRLAMANVVNDMEQVTVKGSLPSGVRFTGKFLPGNEKFVFNERTNEFVWDVGTIAAGTGINGPWKELWLQIEVVPQPNQAGQLLKLALPASMSGRDVFTGRSIEISSKELDTQLTADKTVEAAWYKVEGN